MMQPVRVGIVGAGAWGSALAVVAAGAGHSVQLWARDPGTVAAIRSGRHAPRLPDVALPAAIVATGELADVAASDLVILAVPAQAVGSTAARLAPLLTAAAMVVVTAKGIDRASGMPMARLARSHLPDATIAVLSGPSFAADVAAERPTAVTLAAADLEKAERIAALLATEWFRPYATDDVVGVEIGGALKNVYAIASGMVAGADFGASAQAALIARSLAELTRFAIASGARRETLAGLSGLGDLVLTATTRQSRNFSFGHDIGRGQLTPPFTAHAGAPLVEGLLTVPAAAQVAREAGVDMPILAALDAVLAGRATLADTVRTLLTRPLKVEGV